MLLKYSRLDYCVADDGLPDMSLQYMALRPRTTTDANMPAISWTVALTPLIVLLILFVVLIVCCLCRAKAGSGRLFSDDSLRRSRHHTNTCVIEIISLPHSVPLPSSHGHGRPNGRSVRSGYDEVIDLPPPYPTVVDDLKSVSDKDDAPEWPPSYDEAIAETLPTPAPCDAHVTSAGDDAMTSQNRIT